MKTGLPESGIVNRLGLSLREVHDVWGIPRQEMAGTVPGSWREWSLVTQEGAAPRPSEIGMPAAHDGMTTNPCQTQQQLLTGIDRGAG